MNVEILTGAPDKRGRYGRYGGKFVPETLMVALEELEAAWGTSPHRPLPWWPQQG